MKIINKAERAYIAYNVVIKPNEIIDIEDKKVLDILLQQPNVEEHVDKADIKKVEEENAKLKEQLKEVKAKKTTKKATK